MDSGVDAAGLGQGKRPIVRLRPTVLNTRPRLAGNAETVRMLKERYCHVAPFGHAAADALAGFKPSERRRCVVNSFSANVGGTRGTVVECGGAGELWRTPELLFTDLGDGLGLAQHAAAAVARCDLEARAPLTKNVVLAGGSTCFPGFADR